MERESGWITRATSGDEAAPPSLLATVGGWLGIAEATLPFIAFTIVWTATGRNVVTGGIVAVAISAVLAAARLVRRQTTQFALSGVIGVAFGAFVASRTGKAEDFFLPGILINAASATAYLVSIVVRRPLIGLLVSTVTGEGRAWYRDPARRGAYTKASWIWVGLFSFRLSIQLPLYLSGLVGPLAVARVVTGIPLFALGVWLSYLLLRNVLPELDARTGTTVP
jgi:uncharacterized protein DUF3159